MSEAKKNLVQWGQKLSPEVVATLQKLHDSKEFGGSYDELLRNITGLAQTKKVKEKVPVLAAALDCLEEFYAALHIHLNSAGEAFDGERQKYADITKTQKERFDSTLVTLQAEKAELVKLLEENDPEIIKTEREQAATELKKARDEAARLQSDNSALTAELKAAATEYAAKMEKYAEKTENLNAEIKDMMAKLTAAESENKYLATKLAEATTPNAITAQPAPDYSETSSLMKEWHEKGIAKTRPAFYKELEKQGLLEKYPLPSKQTDQDILWKKSTG